MSWKKKKKKKGPHKSLACSLFCNPTASSPSIVLHAASTVCPPLMDVQQWTWSYFASAGFTRVFNHISSRRQAGVIIVYMTCDRHRIPPVPVPASYAKHITAQQFAPVGLFRGYLWVRDVCQAISPSGQTVDTVAGVTARTRTVLVL